jgi:hypothetical protein
LKALDTWLARNARRERRHLTLEDALLTGRSWAYAAFRVRYLLIRVLLRASLHLAEVMLFSMLFSMDFLGPIIVIRTGTAVAGSVWWGCLEQLRERVRELAAARHWASVRQVIDSWLLLAALLGLLSLGGGAFFILSNPDKHLGFSIFDTYALGCLLRLALDMIARTYHSGMFALRRIYRPLWTLLVCDILDIAVVLALWPLLGPWSFGIALAGVGILRGALTLIYVRRSYRRSKIPPLVPRLLARRLGALPFGELGPALGHGAANATSQIDSLLIITLVMVSSSNDEYLSLAVLLYLIRPFLTAGFGWARLFYFDFKRLERRYSEFFRLRFERFLRMAGLAFAAIMSAIAFVWAGAVWRTGVDLTAALLVPFFLVRSIYGLYQVQAFSYGRYLYLFSITAALGAGILVIALVPLDSVAVLVLLTGLMTITVLAFGPPKGVPAPKARAGRAAIVSLPRWLALLGGEAREVRVVAVAVDTRLVNIGRIVRELARLTPDCAITRYGRGLAIWFETDRPAGHLAEAEVALACAGCVRSLRSGERRAGGRDALREALAAGVLGDSLTRLLTDPIDPHLDGQGLRALFARRFPSGIVLDERGGYLPARKLNLGPDDIQRILIEVSRRSEGVSSRTPSLMPVDLAVYCPCGEPRMVFVLDKGIAPEERSEWRRLVETVTLRHSCDGDRT